MTTMYGTNLEVVDRASSNPADLADVARVVCAWAGVPASVEPLAAIGRAGAHVETEWLPAQGGPDIWRLRYEKEDERSPGTHWRVSVSVLSAHRTEVNVVLDHIRRSPRVGPIPYASPPAIVRHLIGSATLAVVDGGHRMELDTWGVDGSESAALAEFVLSPDRLKPIVAFTGRGDDPFDGGRLLEDLVGLAHVAFMWSKVAWDLDKLLPRGFNVFGGAIRLWWPGVTNHSARWDHPLWSADFRASQAAAVIRSRISAASIAAAGADSRIQAGEALRVERRFAELRARAQTVDVAVNAEPELREAEELVKLYDEQAADSRRDAEEQRRRADHAESEAFHWRQLWETSRVARESPDVGGATDQATSAFLREVDQQLGQVGDVPGARRRNFSLGLSFLDTVEAHGPRYRARILRACSYVALAAPQLLKQLDDHPFRLGPGGNDPLRRRASDRAEGRRCSVESNAPAARRLHYWVLHDGTVEFASVNVHDDMTIPE